MAKTKKGPRKMQTVAAKPIRLDVKPTDHERIQRQADRVGLTIASYVRMVVLRHVEQEEQSK